MDPDTHGADLLAEEAVARVVRWLEAARSSASRRDRTTTRRLAGVVSDRPGTAFAMRFVDRVIRPEDPATSARQLASLVGEAELPSFLSFFDRLLVRAGAWLGPRLPGLVMPIARRRMRALVGHLVVDSEPERLAAHLRTRSAEGFSLNVNMLGEAVLGDAEAHRRHREVLDTLAQPDVDYVSVKVSSVVSQLNGWDFDGSLHRVTEALRPLLRAAASTSPPTFINLDMEEYHDLELTVGAFRRLLEEPEFATLDAGIALQAYLPDSFDALVDLVDWHNAQVRRGPPPSLHQGPLGEGRQPRHGAGGGRHAGLAPGAVCDQGRDRRQLQALPRLGAHTRAHRLGAHRRGQPQPLRRGLGRPAHSPARGAPPGGVRDARRHGAHAGRTAPLRRQGSAAVHPRGGHQGLRRGHRLPVPPTGGERL